ncbi:MAG: hypothetical protein ACRCYO_05120 [Bacteroidia bacterium]
MNQTPQISGVRYGLMYLLISALLIVINVILIMVMDRYFVTLAVAGFATLIAAPIFMIFRGGPVYGTMLTPDIHKEMWAAAPKAHKIAWVTWGIIAVGIAFFVMYKIDPDFLD